MIANEDKPILIAQNNYITAKINNPFFKQEKFYFLFKELIKDSFFTYEMRKSKGLAWSFDLRIPFSQSKYTKIIFPEISKYINSLGYNNFALRGYGSFPFISLSQYGKMDSYVLVRENRKTYGFEEQIEGERLNNLNKLIIIDDLMNRGGSAEKTKLILNHYGLQPDAVFCFINFATKNKQHFNKVCQNLKIHSVIDIYQ